MVEVRTTLDCLIDKFQEVEEREVAQEVME